MTRQIIQLCQHEHCKRPATHAPKLCIPAQGYPRGTAAPLSCLIALPCCMPHLKQIKPEEFLSDQMKQTVAILTAGKTPPDYDRAWIEAAPPEWL